MPTTEYRSNEGGEFLLNNSLLFWVNRLASAMRESFNDDLKSHDLTWPQWMCLNVLSHSDVGTPAQLADALGVDRSAVTRLLDRLAAKGMVEREHDDGDRRSVRIALTAMGYQLCKVLDELAETHQRRYIEQLPATEVRVFKSNIQKLLRESGIETSGIWKAIG